MEGETRKLTEAIDRLARVLESIAPVLLVPQQAAARAGATRGSEPFGTAIANERTVNRTVTCTQEANRSSVRDVTTAPRTDERTGFSWEKVTAAVAAADVETESIRFSAERIARVVRCKQGRYWRNDRRLVVVAAVLAAAFDATSADGQAGSRWLDTALMAVEEFRPDNSAAYFQSVLKAGLAELDPVMHDRSTANMLWIQLCKSIEVPEKWLAERPAVPRAAAEGA